MSGAGDVIERLAPGAGRKLKEILDMGVALAVTTRRPEARRTLLTALPTCGRSVTGWRVTKAEILHLRLRRFR